MNRRLWLKIVGGAAAAASTGVVTWQAVKYYNDPARRLATQLIERFSYLQIPLAVALTFANLHLYHRRRKNNSSQKLSTPLLRCFLLSTDFFQNGADETRPLAFVAYYDPYKSPCYNPLRASPNS